MGSIPQVPNASLRNTVPHTYMLRQKTTVKFARAASSHSGTVDIWAGWCFGGCLGATGYVVTSQLSTHHMPGALPPPQ